MRQHSSTSRSANSTSFGVVFRPFWRSKAAATSPWKSCKDSLRDAAHFTARRTSRADESGVASGPRSSDLDFDTGVVARGLFLNVGVVADTEAVAGGATRPGMVGLEVFSLGALRHGASMSAIRSYGAIRVDLGLGGCSLSVGRHGQ